VGHQAVARAGVHQPGVLGRGGDHRGAHHRGTQYELAEGGTTVLVPQQDVYQLRLDLSAAGLPEDGEAGYELLDEQGITTSEFRQRVDYQRALEGELAKTISSIDGVEVATVHLVIPEESLFSEDGRKPTASVLIKDKAGKSMTDGQVQAVVNLVAPASRGSSTSASPSPTPRAACSPAPARTPQGRSATRGSRRPRPSRRSCRARSSRCSRRSSARQGRRPVSADLDFDKRETDDRELRDRQAGPRRDRRRPAARTTPAPAAVVGGVLGPENVVQRHGGDSTYKKAEGEKTYAVGKTTEQASRRRAP
jgi:flagellar M-ring protein FliF